MNKKTIVALFVVLGLVATGVAYRLKSTTGGTKKTSLEQAVSLVPVKVQDVPLLIDVTGSVVSLQTVEVRAQTSNLVQKVHVVEGRSVQRGATLFSLDDRADRANFDKARSQLERDRALSADLERQYRRAQELKTQNYVAQSAVDTTQAQREAQAALVKSDEAALAAAQVALEYDTIRAPISGRLGVINVYPGTLVQPSSAALVTVTQLDPIAVQFNIPEGSLANLQAAMGRRPGTANVRVRIPASGEELRGNLYFLDNAVDTATGTIKAKAQFANPGHLLWPGQFVQVRIELETLKNVTTIPAAALVTSVNGKFVYVPNEDHTVQAKPVNVRYTFGDSMVVDGLSATDHVVTDGKQNLRAGSKFRAVNSPSAQTDAARTAPADAGSKTPDAARKP